MTEESTFGISSRERKFTLLEHFSLAWAPKIIIPHQPRLDWMVWFVPTQQPLQMEWFGRFMRRLHQGSESVTRL
jgi:predicted small integral membrane protein